MFDRSSPTKTLLVAMAIAGAGCGRNERPTPTISQYPAGPALAFRETDVRGIVSNSNATFRADLTLLNRTAGEIVIHKFTSTCNCAGVETDAALPTTLPANGERKLRLRAVRASMKKERIDVRAETSIGTLSLPVYAWVLPAVSLSPKSQWIELLQGDSRTTRVTVDQVWEQTNAVPSSPQVDHSPSGSIKSSIVSSAATELGDGYLQRSTELVLKLEKPRSDGSIAIFVKNPADGALLEEGRFEWSVRSHAYMVPKKVFVGPRGANAALTSVHTKAEIVGVKSSPRGMTCKLTGPREVHIVLDEDRLDGDVEGQFVLQVHGCPVTEVKLNVVRSDK